MTENEPDILEVTGTPIGTTGRQLREAREAKGWDIHSLSESLHLRPAVLIAIEQGDYREVPELFLKGYVRSYARLVGLDGNRLIRQLESELQPLREEEAERQVENPIFHIEVKKRKKRRIAFWVLLFAFSVVIVFGFIRFQSMGYDFGLGAGVDEQAEGPEPNAGETAAEVFSESAPENIELVDEERIAEGVPLSAGDDSLVEPDPQDGAIEPSATDPAPPAPATVPEEAGPEEAGSEEAGPEEPVSDRMSTPANEPVTPEPAAVDESSTIPDQSREQDVGAGQEVPDQGVSEVAVTAPPVDQVSFVIEFDGDCWIEIRNGAGERIYAALQNAGDRLSQTAQAPVSFVLGNIEGIESFTFDGEPVEIDDYPSRNDRAEITLRANSGN